MAYDQQLADALAEINRLRAALTYLASVPDGFEYGEFVDMVERVATAALNNQQDSSLPKDTP